VDKKEVKPTERKMDRVRKLEVNFWKMQEEEQVTQRFNPALTP
jgi:hypothetical protein